MSFTSAKAAYSSVTGFLRGRPPGLPETPFGQRKSLILSRQFAVGDHIRVNMHQGRIVEATVKAVIETTSGKKLQVDFDHDQTPLAEMWQVVSDAS